MANATILDALSEPFEYVDLAHSMSMTIQVTAFEDGSGLIHPSNPTPKHVRQHMDQNGLTEPPAANMPIGVQVPVLRLFGSRLDKASPSPYWDISSRTLQSQLLPLLDVQAGSTPTTALEARKLAVSYGKVPLQAPLTIKITANGARPQKRYSVEVL
jgi:hypothetical protein